MASNMTYEEIDNLIEVIKYTNHTIEEAMTIFKDMERTGE